MFHIEVGGPHPHTYAEHALSAGNVCFRAILGRRCPSEPDRMSSRILFCTICLAGFFIISLYRAMLGASLAIAIEGKPPVFTLEDIHDFKYDLSGIAHTSYEKLFTHAKKGTIHNKIYEAGLLSPIAFGSEQEAFCGKFNKGLISNTVLLWYFQRDSPSILNSGKLCYSYPCDLSVLQNSIISFPVGFIYQKNWPYTKLLNDHLLLLEEEGITNMLLHKYYNKRRQLCPTDGRGKPRKVQDIIGAFVLLGIGMMTAFVCVAFEKWRQSKMQNLKQVTGEQR